MYGVVSVMFYFDVLAYVVQLHILYYGLGNGIRSQLNLEATYMVNNKIRLGCSVL
ncbi:hypothetical protein BDV27DRAFT_125730 [Aspergillus caelatus]|uniref:Uncharacterized protein n=1 Tax=Aspergillus caelatus TaxID=61420 RepID=A0A5N7A9S0_9EURO|nr:uncharacterized protein BDV27DRAFT_125730 [Aspergillus caelatus]KAE8366118.1 hypothetical protein BDV27DRAFT_125730 [Aspergillus caelatus]